MYMASALKNLSIYLYLRLTLPAVSEALRLPVITCEHQSAHRTRTDSSSMFPHSISELPSHLPSCLHLPLGSTLYTRTNPTVVTRRQGIDIWSERCMV
ncbi:hypothetical protein EDB89DRAFT_548550 [Lactarius sanguifluus]|nr:hypothetical protein EDB89DRAFT_548550 [Lactarius sanguifluus]